MKSSPAASFRGRPLRLAVRRHPLVAEVQRRLAGRCAVPAGARVVVGLSGGPDSVALLLAAASLRDRRRDGVPVVEPVAAHVNHHLRPSAAADEAFAAALCRDLGVPLLVRHVEPGALAGSTAANARRLRYAALDDVAGAVEAPFVAVAHHAEDQLETLLMALGRGAGVDGLAGMAWRRPLGPATALLRPLLGATKADCESLCRAAGTGWRLDPTNADPDAARSRLRREVLPVLDDLWPDAARRAGHAADAAAAARAALDAQLDAVFGDTETRCWSRQALRVLPAAAIAAGLRRAAESAAPQAARHLAAAQLTPAAEAVADGARRPRRFDWPGGLRVEVTARAVRLVGP